MEEQAQVPHCWPGMHARLTVREHLGHGKASVMAEQGGEEVWGGFVAAPRHSSKPQNVLQRILQPCNHRLHGWTQEPETAGSVTSESGESVGQHAVLRNWTWFFHVITGQDALEGAEVVHAWTQYVRASMLLLADLRKWRNRWSARGAQKLDMVLSGNHRSCYV